SDSPTKVHHDSKGNVPPRSGSAPTPAGQSRLNTLLKHTPAVRRRLSAPAPAERNDPNEPFAECRRHRSPRRRPAPQSEGLPARLSAPASGSIAPADGRAARQWDRIGSA